MGILFALAIVGVAVLIATFDIDRYRPQIVSRLEETLGKPVSIQKISMGWSGGLSLKVKGFSVKQPAPSADSLLEAEETALVLRLKPLLKKQVQIASIAILRPSVFIRKGKDGSIDLMELSSAGRPPPLQPVPAGQTVSEAPPVSSPRAQPAFSIERIVIQQGSLQYEDQASQPPFEIPLEEIQAEAAVRPDEIRVNRFSAVMAQGTIAGSGSVTLSGPFPKVNLKLEVDRMQLDALVPARDPSAPSLRGRFSVRLEGFLEGTQPDEIQRSVAAAGQVELAEGMIVNLNILKEVFQRISIIPGLSEKLMERLPESYKERFNVPHTVLKRASTQIVLSNGTAAFNNLHVETDSFTLAGSVNVRLDGAVDGRATLKIDPELSLAMIKSVNELQSLADREGRVGFPVIIQGTAPRVSVLPDLDYLAKYLLVTAVQDLVGDLLQKAFEKNQ